MAEESQRKSRLEAPNAVAIIDFTMERESLRLEAYLRHDVSEDGLLLVWTTDDSGDEWPRATVAPGKWISLTIVPLDKPRPGSEAL